MCGRGSEPTPPPQPHPHPHPLPGLALSLPREVNCRGFILFLHFVRPVNQYGYIKVPLGKEQNDNHAK